MAPAAREAGAWMRVMPDDTCGTIGGGAAEHRATAEARAMLEAGTTEPRRLSLPLGAETDQCCGGRMTLALAPMQAVPAGGAALWPGGPRLPVPPPSRALYLYGAGHVGRAIAAAVSPLPFALTWIDARVGLPPAEGPGAHFTTPLPEAAAAEAPPGAFHLVLTHSHALDLEIVAAVLETGRAGYLGLIGSSTKRALFRRRLAERGIDDAGLTCPIGLPGIADKRPGVIAASVAADLLRLDAALRAGAER
ncbi:MAG: xanthine dehydrogenase accessory protein XdhC [Pseudomonadota bacterium]